MGALVQHEQAHAPPRAPSTAEAEGEYYAHLQSDSTLTTRNKVCMKPLASS